MSKDKNLKSKEEEKKLGEINELDAAALSEASGGYFKLENGIYNVYDKTDKIIARRSNDRYGYGRIDAINIDKAINGSSEFRE